MAVVDRFDLYSEKKPCFYDFRQKMLVKPVLLRATKFSFQKKKRLMQKLNIFFPFWKERFTMNYLFASNFIYSFQICAKTLFLVIHTELHKEVLAPQKGSCHFIVPV